MRDIVVDDVAAEVIRERLRLARAGARTRRAPDEVHADGDTRVRAQAPRRRVVLDRPHFDGHRPAVTSQTVECDLGQRGGAEATGCVRVTILDEVRYRVLRAAVVSFDGDVRRWHDAESSDVSRRPGDGRGADIGAVGCPQRDALDRQLRATQAHRRNRAIHVNSDAARGLVEALYRGGVVVQLDRCAGGVRRE